MEIQDYLCPALIIIAILSTLLIFVIAWWIVLIINICTILLAIAAFRETVEVSGWVYVVEFGLAIIIMVIVMLFPEKICGGTMQFITDSKFVMQYFGKSFQDATSAELTKRFYSHVGICLVIFIINLIIGGIIFSCRLYKLNENYSVEEVWEPYYLSIPLSCMGGLIIANCPLYLGASIGLGIAYGSILTFSKILGAIVCAVPSGDDNDSSGGSGKTYHVFIVED